MKRNIWFPEKWKEKINNQKRKERNNQRRKEKGKTEDGQKNK
jgi:hypothetical protein